MTKAIRSFLLIGFISFLGSQQTSIHQQQSEQYKDKNVPPSELVEVQTGLDILLTKKKDLLKGKNIALVTNHTGVDKNGIPNFKLFINLPDVTLEVIFSPEHGLFGEAEAGQKIDYQEDRKEFPKIVSLYGKSRKPDPALLKGLDWVIYDIQDVGARFYTYISTLGLVMESAAEAGVPIMVLDRPNPIRGDKVEGPVLNPEFQSFVGFYPIPVRYGLTVGELAKMIAGEKWINPVPELTVIWMVGWKRNLWYDETTLLWRAPSPNIPTMETAIVYPGTCFIEATNVSEGRGTDNPFLWIGAPWVNASELSQELNKQNLAGVVFKPITFFPKEIPGVSINPKFNGLECKGVEIVVINKNSFLPVLTGVALLSSLNQLYPKDLDIRESSLDRLWGGDDLTYKLETNGTVEEVFNTYSGFVKWYTRKRNRYLHYGSLLPE